MNAGFAADHLIAGKNRSSQVIRSHSIPDLPSIAEVEPYLKRIDEARWYTNFGPLVREFESRLRDLVSARHADLDADNVFLTTLSSGYDALEAGLRLLRLKGGGRVLVPAVTFCACPLAVQHAGLEVALTDVDPTSWVLTPTIARAAAGRMELAAVMPVAAYGVPLPAAGWDEFSRDTGVPVVLDAAAAFESQSVLRRGLVAHSLHATKPLGIGEGGVLVGCDADLIEAVREYSNFGMIDRVGHADGANAKMSEYHAAVGLAQLKRWTDIKRKRKRLLDLYRTQLAPLSDCLQFQPGLEDAVVSCLMLRIKDPASDFMAAAKETGHIAFHRTYLPPLYRHPYFSGVVLVDTDGNALAQEAGMAEKTAHMLNSEELMRFLLGVPFHPFMNEDDVNLVAETMKSMLS